MQRDFDLRERNEALSFLRELYNYGEEMESINNELDAGKREDLVALKAAGEGLKSLSSLNSYNEEIKATW